MKNKLEDITLNEDGFIEINEKNITINESNECLISIKENNKNDTDGLQILMED